MFEGLEEFQKDLKEAQVAIQKLDGELGSVSFDADDPQSIENAIQSMFQIIDERVGQYAANPVVGPLIEQMKETYREAILEKASEARLKAEDS